MGYHRAGFNVVGVDIKPQPNYPFPFIQVDAMMFPLDGYDVIHASPPCQAFSRASGQKKGDHADLLTPTAWRLWGRLAIIENVPQSPIRKDAMLCGEMFALRLHRHRYFETIGFSLPHRIHPEHKLRAGRHNCHIERGYTRVIAGHFAGMDSAQKAMGIDWMTRHELSQAIPPAYTEYIGRQLLSQITMHA
jgi:DNA (cytosine-5)-methyltransferase 1